MNSDDRSFRIKLNDSEINKKRRTTIFKDNNYNEKDVVLKVIKLD